MTFTDYVIVALKLIVALSILNVWLIQPKKKTKWRGGDATTIIEEFKAYGLSETFCYVVGFLKVGLALILLASLKFENLTLIGSIGLSLLLLGSIAMHVKIKDPLFKSFPAFLFIVLNLIIILLSQ
ncbi:DoxX family protein [Winogradskyella sp.]|uniref:DoxX family protein n=1 Tax=Winogradskyella sp. TaxID=1883156 RepID=UPI003F6B6998